MWKVVADQRKEGATIVRVLLAHTGVTQSTKSKADKDGIKLFNRIGNWFQWDDGGWDTPADSAAG